MEVTWALPPSGCTSGEELGDGSVGGCARGQGGGLQEWRVHVRRAEEAEGRVWVVVEGGEERGVAKVRRAGPEPRVWYRDASSTHSLPWYRHHRSLSSTESLVWYSDASGTERLVWYRDVSSTERLVWRLQSLWLRVVLRVVRWYQGLDKGAEYCFALQATNSQVLLDYPPTSAPHPRYPPTQLRYRPTHPL
eukprot:3202-Rhodomonas_salina.1